MQWWRAIQTATGDVGPYWGLGYVKANLWGATESGEAVLKCKATLATYGMLAGPTWGMTNAQGDPTRWRKLEDAFFSPMSEKIVITDTRAHRSYPTWFSYEVGYEGETTFCLPGTPHMNGANLLFADQHVEWRGPDSSKTFGLNIPNAAFSSDGKTN